MMIEIILTIILFITLIINDILLDIESFYTKKYINLWNRIIDKKIEKL